MLRFDVAAAYTCDDASFDSVNDRSEGRTYGDGC